MKYLTKKVIKGKTYYYFQYRRYNKNLGTVMPSDIKGSMIKFFSEIAKKEYGKLSPKIKKGFSYGNLKRVEELHYMYISFKHDLFGAEYMAFFNDLIILFTYHSNRAEGSRTTREEIELFSKTKIRKPKTKTSQEIFNSLRAFKFAFSSEMKWNIKSIKYIHALLLENLDPLIAGKWKNENNTAPGNQPTTSFGDVSCEMKRLINWFNKECRNKDSYPPALALEFYCRLEQIHPFIDGNGRVGRILFNAILDYFNYFPVVFFSENRNEHSAAIKQAINGRYNKLNKHFLSQARKTDQVLVCKHVVSPN
ncbi:MAG: Fic family protein [Candidatus Anammoxibacter sp.]